MTMTITDPQHRVPYAPLAAGAHRGVAVVGFSGVTRRYGATTALRDVDLRIDAPVRPSPSLGRTAPASRRRSA